ncbi:MAG: DUF4440 domain-containing protein [bacterium]|nr:DUF4440 domain-containing protein [bacterium]
MKKILVILLIIAPIMMKAQNIELQKEILLEKDRQLNKLSKKKGTFEAFLKFISDDVILMPRFGHPIHTKESFKKIIGKLDDKSKFNIKKWKPIYVDIANKGDIGYTLGRYVIENKEKDNSNLRYNYYASVWKKQKNGNWKIIIHSGLIGLDSIDFITEKDMNTKLDKSVVPIANADKKFSELSVKSGYLHAFYTFIAENGLVASGNGRPPSNKETYRKRVEQSKKEKPRTELKLKWKPLYGDMSSSNDLGFTHGHAEIVSKDDKGEENRAWSYYLTIWKKQKDGKWKYVLDTGNYSTERK